MQKSLTSYGARLKKRIIIRLETHAIAGKINASYISEVVNKLTKGQKKLSRGSSRTIMIMNCQLKQWYAKTNQNTFCIKTHCKRDDSTE